MTFHPKKRRATRRDRAFTVVETLLAMEAQLNELDALPKETDPAKGKARAARRKRLVDRIRTHKNAITPPEKRAALAPKSAAKRGVIVPTNKSSIHTWRGQLREHVANHCRCFGVPTNIAAFIRDLRRNGWLTVSNASKRTFTYSDSSARRILRDVFAQHRSN
jgi:hypothetical protein